MKRAATAILLTVLLLLVLGLTASVASAGGSVKTILTDASDGVVDGSYSAAQVRAALAVVRRDPAYMQYSDIEGVLVDYMGTLGGNGGSSSNQQGGSTDATPGQNATPSKGATPSKKATPSKSAAQETPGDSASAASPAGSAQATGTPVSSVSAWDRVKVRLAAVPWFFAVVAVGLVTGVVLLRRHRAG